MRADEVRGGPKFGGLFQSLNQSTTEFKELDGILAILQEDFTKGDRIQKNLWPKCYIDGYDIRTLYRMPLSGGRRLIYTVYSTGGIMICDVLEVLSHKEYEQRFDY